MAKVLVVSPDRAQVGAQPQGFAGEGEVRTYLEGERFPIQLHHHRLATGQQLEIGPLPVECAAYVWRGEAEAGGTALSKGSSIIVEKGQVVTVAAGADGAELLAFAAAKPASEQADGGHVHLLPAGQVPRYGEDDSHQGGLHADSDCPTCSVWLHENHFPPAEPLTEEQQKGGVHSHSEDEIIFVIDGEMRLGSKPAGPGTALAIAADTLYSFSPGPGGLSFINFRAAMPSEIKFANGHSMSETGYWREKVSRPEYLEAAG